MKNVFFRIQNEKNIDGHNAQFLGQEVHKRTWLAIKPTFIFGISCRYSLHNQSKSRSDILLNLFSNKFFLFLDRTSIPRMTKVSIQQSPLKVCLQYRSYLCMNNREIQSCAIIQQRVDSMSQKKINGYVIFMKQVLGKGSYGSVYRGEQDGTKQPCAIKILQKSLIDQDDYLKSALFSQVQILQLLKSQNVVRVLDVMESSHNYYIIQEICDSDLEHYLEKHKQITQQEAISFLRQICNGFIALVKEGIVHRDLKPANIMLSKGVVKIGDFGFAKKNITKRMKNATSVGTPLYMPLQILKSEAYTSKCDVWATGFIFYQMLHGRTPWTAHTQFELVKNIETKALVLNSSLRPETRDFLTRCLKIHEKDRMSWDEVFMHPIFQGYFHKYAQQNQQFQDKLKMVMSELRFQINSKNLDLNRLLEGLGFKGLKELNFHQFSQFLRHIHPGITKDEVKFFFQRMDSNDDGSISIQQLTTQMEKHRINFNKNTAQTIQTLTNNIFNVKKSQSLEQSFDGKKITNELQFKVKKCFAKLFKILSSKQLTLYKTFSAYDTDKSGQLTIDEFEKIMKRLDNTFSQDEITAVFDYIDTDKSKTIEFDELSSYYCKVNGIPELLQLPSDYKKK